MTTCNDIDQSLSALAASNNARFAAMQSQLDACCAKTDSLALEVAKAVQDSAQAVSAVAGAISEIAQLSAILAPLVPAVASATAAVAGLVAAIGGILISIATLNVLGGRVDAVESGLSGLAGEVGSNYTDLRARILGISLTPGANGADGANGAKGDKGDIGERGFTGEKGDAGNKGDKGDKGDRGDTGLTGFTGSNGLDGANGFDGRTPVFGVDYFNGANGLNGQDGRDGSNGLSGITPVKNVDYFDGVDGVNGIDGLDGVDKGMDCNDMTACIAPFFNNLQNQINNIDVKADNIKIGQDGFVQEQAIQWVGLIPKILTIIGGINTVLELISSLRNLFTSSPDPLTEAEVRIIIDSFIPNFAGTVNGSDCAGTTITKQYQGKGLIGIERLIGATTDLTNELFSDLCNVTNPQGFINTVVCGKPFTGTFRGEVEGIQRLGDLIGFAISETCDKVGNIDVSPSIRNTWEVNIKPSLEIILDNKFNENFPTISDTFSVDLCDGTTKDFGYLGKGFNGVRLALSTMQKAQNEQTNSYFACLIAQLFPEYSGILTTSFCDGTDFSVSYLERGVSGLNNVLKLQNSLNVLWQQRFAECFINSTDRRYSGNFVTQKCDGSNLTGIYNNLLVNEVLEVMFDTLEKKIDDLCGDYQDTAVFTDCEGNIINTSYQGKGYRGLQVGMKVYAITLSQIINKLCNAIAPQVTDSFSVSLCDGTVRDYGYLGNGFQGIRTGLAAMHKAQTDQIDSYFACIIKAFYPEYSGILTTSFCDGTDYAESYLERGVEGLNNVLKLQNKMNVIWQNRFAECFLQSNSERRYSGEFRTEDCFNSNITETYNNMTIQGVLEAMFRTINRKLYDLCPNFADSITEVDCMGVTQTWSYQGTGYQGLQAAFLATASLNARLIRSLCEKLEDNPNVSGTINAVICGKPYSYTYGVPESALDGALVLGTFDILSRSIEELCRLVEPEQRQIYNVTGDICNELINYPLLLTSSEFQVAQSSVSATSSLAAKVCSLITEMECDPAVIEPSEKYRERVITSQMTIWFYPVGTTKSQRKTSPKWRLTISNPRPNLTCADFAPLTWQRGKWLSKVLFDMGAIETYSYFADFDPDANNGDAIDKMLYLASLSTIPINPEKPLPRVTRSNSVSTNLPNQAIMEVVRVIFVEYDANGQKTNVKCLQCVP